MNYDLDTRILKLDSRLNVRMLRWYIDNEFAYWAWQEMLDKNPHYCVWAVNTFKINL
jgi:hypothetical protein